jgi:hypothetical protein
MKLTRCYLIRNKVCAYYGNTGRTVVIDCSSISKAEEIMKHILSNNLEYNDCIDFKNEMKNEIQKRR